MMRSLGPAAALFLSACAGPYQVGDERFRSGDYVSAHEAYQAAMLISPPPSDPEIGLHIEMARAEAARSLHLQAVEKAGQGDLNGAIHLLERARKINPNNQEATAALEKTALRKEEALRKAAEGFQAALAAASEKDWDRALSRYKESIAANPNHFLARAGRHRAGSERSESERLHQEGEAMLAGKRLETALARFEASRERWPFHPRADASRSGVKALLDRAAELLDAGNARAEGGEEERFRKLEEALQIHPHMRAAAEARADLLLGIAAGLAGSGQVAGGSIVACEARDGLSAFRDEAGNEVPELLVRVLSMGEEIRGWASRIGIRAGYFLQVAAEGSGPGQPFPAKFAPELAEAWRRLRKDARVEVAGRGPPGGGSGPMPVSRFLLRLSIEGPKVTEARSQKALEKEYVSGYREEPNPEYRTAQEEVEAAEEGYQRAVNEHRRRSDENQRQAEGNEGAIIAAGLAGALGEMVLPEKAALDRARDRLAETPPVNKVPIRAIHRYAKVTVSRTARLKVSFEVNGQDVRLEDEEAFENSTTGSFFENPRPDLDIPDAPPPLAKDEELISSVTKEAIIRVTARAEERLRKEILRRRVTQAREAERAGDLPRAVELAADAWSADHAGAPPLLREQGITDEIQAGGGDPSGFFALCRALRRKLLPPPRGVAAIFEAGKTPHVPRGGPSPDLLADPGERGEDAAPVGGDAVGPAEAAPCTPPVKLIAAGIRPPAPERGSVAELFMRYEVAGGAGAVVEERRIILHQGRPVEGMPLTHLFPVPEGQTPGQTVESVIRLPVPAEGIPTGEYELEVRALTGASAGSKTLKFTIR